jgi:hypothetical protein
MLLWQHKNNQVNKINSDKIMSVVIYDILGREIAKKEKLAKTSFRYYYGKQTLIVK